MRYLGNRYYIAVAILLLCAVDAYPQSDSIPFSLPFNYSDGDSYNAICLADFDNDGDIDMIVPQVDTLVIMTNEGNGNFVLSGIYLISTPTIGPNCVADFDSDGDNDLAVCTYSGIPGVSILLNNGDGTFQPRIRIETGDITSLIFASDLDGDGNIDIAVTEPFANAIRVLRNDGTGHFQVGGSYEVGGWPECLIAVDLDGDQENELATTISASNEVAVLDNLGDGSFGPPTTYAVGTTPISLCTADFDNDGDYDLAVANFSSNNVTILENDGSGIFTFDANISVIWHPFCICAADLDSDGDQDLAVTNDNPTRLMSVLNNYGDGTFQPAVNYTTRDTLLEGGAQAIVCAADLDNDDAIDLVAGGSHTLDVIRNQTVVTNLAFMGELSRYRAINHTPTFEWRLRPGHLQEQFEIQIGTDPDWSTVELWNPSTLSMSDTFIVYGGGPLYDGNTYYFRLRAYTNGVWTQWLSTSFRMNSVPAVPVNKRPDVLEAANTTTPTLWVLNSSDPENDPLFYDFEVLDFSENVVASASGIAGQTDSTGWTVDVPLVENGFYYWQARAFDGYEYSAWSFGTLFLINVAEEYPSSFLVYFPPDTDSYGQMYEKPLTFRWGTSTDPDPIDTVRYNLLISIDPEFTFVAAYNGLYGTQYPVGNLAYGTHYWWKVQAVDMKGHTTTSTNTADFWTWILGDANHDRTVNVGDAVFIINFIFKDGAAVWPLKTGDVNADCTVNVGDAVALINYIFKGGDPPGVGCAEGR